jgi:hypothetical protein
VPLSLYLHFIIDEKRAKHIPHLLAGFSPVSGFLSHIPCSFVWLVCSFACSFIFEFQLFSINLNTKLVIINLRSKEINCIIKDFKILQDLL